MVVMTEVIDCDDWWLSTIVMVVVVCGYGRSGGKNYPHKNKCLNLNVNKCC